jgi:hypothetical protein
MELAFRYAERKDTALILKFIKDIGYLLYSHKKGCTQNLYLCTSFCHLFICFLNFLHLHSPYL